MAVLNLNLSKSDVETMKKERPILNDQYSFYQPMRSFIADLIDCYDEKLQEIERIESKWINLMKERSNKISSRRQLDIKDQNVEYSLSTNVEQKSLEPSHQRRIADRDYRRLRRKQNRDSNKEHYDGLSSDDDDNLNNTTIFNQKRSIFFIFKKNLEI
jgi:hypothetical protein